MKKIGISIALLGLLLVGVLVAVRSRAPAPEARVGSATGEPGVARTPATEERGFREIARPGPAAPTSASPQPRPTPPGLGPAARAKDIYSALGLDAEQTRHAKDILWIQRERLLELSASMRRREITLPQFQAAMREIARKTDANMQSVLGEEKLKQWRAYQRRRAAHHRP